MKGETFYFSHDYSTRADEKIKKLLRIYGMEGYGIFWSIIEDLYNNANALRLDYDCIAYDLRVDSDKVEHIINDFGLFVIDTENFGSISVERRLEERNKKSELARQSAFKRWSKQSSDANVMPTQCDSNAIKERKGKERKIKERKMNKTFVPPLVEEVMEYFKENGYSKESALKAFNHYALAEWHDTGGKPVLNWKQKMNTVWFKDENRIKSETEHRVIGGYYED